MYDNDWFPVDDRLRSKKLNKRKRGAGRPAKVKPALNKTPPRNMIEEEDYLETGNEVAEIPVIDWNNELTDHSEIENHSIDSILFDIGNLVPTQDIPPPNFDSLPSTSFDSALSSSDQVNQTKTVVQKKDQVYIPCSFCGKVMNKKSMKNDVKISLDQILIVLQY